MTNTDTSTQAEGAESKSLRVYINKAKQFIDVDLSQFGDEFWSHAVMLGVTQMLEKGMTKVKTAKLEGEDLEAAKAAALELAQTNLEAIYSGEYQIGRAKKPSKVAGKVKVRAVQMARIIVKAKMKEQGLKVSHYTARSITEAAENLLEDHPEIIDEAKRELEEEDRKKSAVTIDLTKIMKPDKKRVEAATKRAAEAKATRQRKERTATRASA